MSTEEPELGPADLTESAINAARQTFLRAATAHPDDYSLDMLIRDGQRLSAALSERTIHLRAAARKVAELEGAIRKLREAEAQAVAEPSFLVPPLDREVLALDTALSVLGPLDRRTQVRAMRWLAERLEDTAP